MRRNNNNNNNNAERAPRGSSEHRRQRIVASRNRRFQKPRRKHTLVLLLAVLLFLFVAGMYRYMFLVLFWNDSSSRNSSGSGSSFFPSKPQHHFMIPPNQQQRDNRSNQGQSNTNNQGQEELIDMRQLTYELAFDNPDGGAWKQGWNVEASTKQDLQIFVVPHSHCDPGWIKTFDEYFRSQTSRILTTVVTALGKDRRRTFVWAEISYFSWWYEEQETTMQQSVRQLLRNKQLEFVTGGWVQPDEANSELYAMEVQLQEGHAWIRQNLGDAFVPKVGWSIDPFGYSPSAAYLWKQYNFTGMLIQRVHYAVKKHLAERLHLEFFWRQTWDTVGPFVLDHHQRVRPHDIFTHVMPFFSYDIPHTCGPDPAVCCQFDFGRLPSVSSVWRCPWKIPPVTITHDNVQQRAMLLLDQYRKKAALYRSHAVLAPLGDDFRWLSEAEAEAQYTNYQKLFDYINEHVEGVTIQFGTLSQYFEAARATFEGNVPILKGSFFTYSDVNEDYWSGYFTSRVFDKALDRRLERVLFAAESLPEGKGHGDLQESRRALSLFQHHDGVTGTAKDHVVEDYARRMNAAVMVTQKWMVSYVQDYLKTELPSSNVNIHPCFVATAPRDLASNYCDDLVVAYNPLSRAQSCGNVTVEGETFARVTLPCEEASVIPNAKIIFDPSTGLMTAPIKEEWKYWKVKKGGAYLFFPDTLHDYDQASNHLTIKEGGFVVETVFWKRTVVVKEIPSEFGSSSTVIDFVYETDLREDNQEWIARFSADIANGGYFHTDLNGFNFDTHRFRKDLPIQSQVFPMPTLASIEDRNKRLTVVSEHAQGTASLQEGSIDIWLDRRLKQDDGKGLAQGVQDNRPVRTRLRVLIESEAYEAGGEFNTTRLCKHMWDELQHPLEFFGEHRPDVEAEVSLVLENAAKGLKGDPGAANAPPGLQGNTPRDITVTQYSVDETVLPFVFMVYNRVDYLKLAIESLRKSDTPKKTPVIISIDGHIQEMMSYTDSLKKEFDLHVFIHPHSCSDHPDSFPGSNKTLTDSYSGDRFGNPRTPSITCCKHHFTWLLMRVFTDKKFEKYDSFLFLEEDYIVAPTIYGALVNGMNAMEQFRSETKGGFFGLCLDPTDGNRRKTKKLIDQNAWYGAPFASGPMTMNRKMFNDIRKFSASYCGKDGFDDYNWDWSLVHMQNKGLIPYTVLVPAQMLAKHIGIEGGMHGHKKPKDAETATTLDSTFLGNKLSGFPRVNKGRKAEGYGGWGHPADQDHCMKLLEIEQ